MEKKIKSKRVKGMKVMSSGFVKPYPLQEEILTALPNDSEGVIYNLRKSK